MSKPLTAVFCGAGIVGRTLALHLAAKQLRVALVTQGSAPPHLRRMCGPTHSTPPRAPC